MSHEFKVSPVEVADWDSGLFDYACVYISELDKIAEERANDMKKPKKNAPQTMRGGTFRGR